MITRIVEKPGTRTKTAGRGKREYEYVLTAVSNLQSDDEWVIQNHPRVPREGTPYVGPHRIDALAPLRELIIHRISEAPGVYVWEVTCRYSSESDDEGGKKKEPEKPKDPLRWPTEIHWGSRIVQKSGTNDVGTGGILGPFTKKPLVNSVGDLLKDAPPFDIYHGLVTLSRYEAFYNPVAAMQYAGRINSTRWFACPPFSAKMEWPEAVLTYIAEIDRYVWKISYTFEIAPELWQPIRIADRGTRVFLPQDQDPASNYGQQPRTKVQAKDDFGEAAGDEVYLNGKGEKLDVDFSKGVLPYMLEFKYYLTADFNRLGLP